MDYEIVTRPATTVAGTAVRTTNAGGKAAVDIGQAWQALFTTGAYSTIPHKANAKTIGLYTDYEGDFTAPYLFLAGCEVTEPPAEESGLVYRTIPAGKYARFLVRGDMQQAVGAFWTELWQMELNRKYTADFEEYQTPAGDPSNQEIHIYIALKE